MRKYQKGFFIAESRKLLKCLDPGQFGDYSRPGIRAQLLNLKTDELVMDFLIEHAEKFHPRAQCRLPGLHLRLQLRGPHRRGSIKPLQPLIYSARPG